MYRFLFAGIAAFTLVLAGCTLSRPEIAREIDWAAREAQLGSLDRWDARGRIAVKHEGGGGQGEMQWQQEGLQTRIRLNGPFGAGAYEIRWDADTLAISSRHGEYSRAYTGRDSAQQFLNEHLGWSFPATSARYWLLGIPDPAYPAQQVFSETGRLLSLAQNGWTVSYERFAEYGALAMPAKLSLENAHARVRLAIDRWCLVPECAAR